MYNNIFLFPHCADYRAGEVPERNQVGKPENGCFIFSTPLRWLRE